MKNCAGRLSEKCKSTSMAQRHVKCNSSFSPVLPSSVSDCRISFPPGISNGGYLCYGISVVRCLLYHSTFRGLSEGMRTFHGEHCKSCLSKDRILLTTKQSIHILVVHNCTSYTQVQCEL